MDTITLIITIMGVLIALVVGGGQIYLAKKMKDFECRQDLRDESRRKNLIYAESTKFIQKYNSKNNNSEILLLPMCVTAYKYNATYPYNREIYREFCILTEDIQNEIIKRLNLNLKSFKEPNYYYDMLDILTNVIKENYPNDKDIFYEGGKYLHRALLNHGEKENLELQCSIDETTKKDTDYLKNFTNKKTNIDYFNYITDMLVYNKDEHPIEQIWNKNTTIGSPNNGSELLASYVCCIIAKYAMIYSNKDEDKDKYLGFNGDYQGVLYMEDLFLDALHTIEMYNKNKKEGNRKWQ